MMVNMDNNKLKQLVEKVLKKDERLWDENKTDLNEILLIDLVEHIDEKVIELLLQEKKIREKFFVKIKDVYVFKTNDFRFFIEENKIDNSFTDYKNRIGLTDGKKFLKDTNDVVLDFPYKDCVLEGGQSTEEGNDTYFEYEEEKTKTVKGEKVKEESGYKEKQGKRKEIFFNQVLAHDEIDRLLDHKALTNWKRFNKDGEQEVKEIKRDEDGTIKENLIIKGNNLIALHSLKKQFTGKVKLIYIDPPYNTGGATDIFTYNNSFNHSTWLTFMRNRLEAGKQLLKNDGFIAITIDHVELFYLGAVADEIFGKENRVGIVTVYINPKGRQHENFFSASTEYMLVYANNINVAKFNNITIDEEKSKSFDLEDENGKYRLDKFLRARTSTSRTEKPDFYYPIYASPDLKEITTTKQKRYFEVFPIENKKEYTWKTKKDTFEERLKEDNFVALKNNGEVQIFNKFREQQVFKNLWTDKKYFPEFQGTNLLKKILGRNAFSYPKSLYAVLDTIKIMTSDNDIILDFHAGSGTTGHATLALNKEDGGNRKFILVEQLDEHIEICNERNQKVLAQENINDSFIYCEIAKWNETAKEKILECESLDELEKLFDEMYEKYFLNYNLKIKEFKEKVLKEENFKNLSLEEQKKMFVAMLDNNQMYVNKTEMADKKFGIGKKDQELTEKFYNCEK